MHHLGHAVGYTFLGSIQGVHVRLRSVIHAQDAGARDKVAPRVMGAPGHRGDQHRLVLGHQQVPDLLQQQHSNILVASCNDNLQKQLGLGRRSASVAVQRFIISVTTLNSAVQLKTRASAGPGFVTAAA